jgi:hypothetical protein
MYNSHQTASKLLAYGAFQTEQRQFRLKLAVALAARLHNLVNQPHKSQEQYNNNNNQLKASTTSLQELEPTRILLIKSNQYTRFALINPAIETPLCPGRSFLSLPILEAEH